MTVLRGNHEQMLLDALAEQEPGEGTGLWEWNGAIQHCCPSIGNIGRGLKDYPSPPSEAGTSSSMQGYGPE